MKANLIRRSPFQLRPVKKHTVAYLQLRKSIEKYGILQPLLVRETTSGLEIIDGAHRHECALDLRIDAPIHIVKMSDVQVLEAQVIANEQRIKTLDSDIVKRLWKISKNLDHRELAASLGKSLSWLKAVCGLERLTPATLDLWNSGKFTFRQAILLSRIPRKQQHSCWFMDESQLQHVVRSLKIVGVKPSVIDVTPTYRPIQFVIDELQSPSDAGLIILNETDGRPVEIWKAALRWVLQMDKTSFNKRKKKHENLDDNFDLPTDNIGEEHSLTRKNKI